jgi:hypothetical protein
VDGTVMRAAGPGPAGGLALRCDECGRAVRCPAADVLRFAEGGRWPRCCGEVMSLAAAGGPASGRSPAAAPAAG